MNVVRRNAGDVSVENHKISEKVWPDASGGVLLKTGIGVFRRIRKKRLLNRYFFFGQPAFGVGAVDCLSGDRALHAQ